MLPEPLIDKFKLVVVKTVEFESIDVISHNIYSIFSRLQTTSEERKHTHWKLSAKSGRSVPRKGNCHITFQREPRCCRDLTWIRAFRKTFQNAFILLFRRKLFRNSIGLQLGHGVWYIDLVMGCQIGLIGSPYLQNLGLEVL